MTGGKGGDVVFSNAFVAGKGYAGGADGDFVFTLADGREVLRIAGDGHFLVAGRVVAKDEMVYLAFRYWLGTARIADEEVQP